MKKISALLCSALLAVGAASAQEQTLDFGYCDDSGLGQGYLNEAQGPTGAAIQLSEDIVNAYKGFKITHVLVCNGSTSRVLTGGVKVHINIFASEDAKLPKNPTTLTGEDNLMNLTKAGEWNEYELAQPIEVKENTPLWVGFVCPDADSGDSPVAIDMRSHGDDPCNYTVTVSGNGNYVWGQLAKFWGAVGIKVRLVGEGLPSSIVTIGSGSMEVSTVSPNVPFNVGFTFKNGGFDTVETLGVACSINGAEEEIVTVTPQSPVSANGNGTAYFQFTCPEQLYNARLECRVAEVNGKPNTATEGTTFGSTFTCVDKIYSRAMVVEEGTGTWCAWCVRGIVGLESMAEEHKDGSFIGIAVHFNDPMTPKTYGEIFSSLGTYPSCLVNREKSIGKTDPMLSNLQNLYTRITSSPAIVEVKPADVKVDAETATVKISTNLTFAMDIDEADFGVSYVIIEDQVGPYSQANGYANGAAGAMGGWENKGESVMTFFNDVARHISSYAGDENSLPTAIEGGKTYTYTATLPTAYVNKVANMRYAALVIDRNSGTILNGRGFTEADADPSAIETVETDEAEAPATYFDLLGRPVAKPAPGQLLISNGRKVIM